MDRFEEISPFHINNDDAILSELMNAKVRRDLVTLRNVKKERNEK